VKIKVKLSEHSNNNKAAFDNFWGVFLMLLALRDSWDIPTYLNAKFPLVNRGIKGFLGYTYLP